MVIMSQTTYPTQIEEVLTEWQEALQDPEFLKEQEIDHAYVKQATRDVFGPVLMEQWLNIGEVGISENLAEPLIKRFIVAAILLEMKSKGLVDSIEDENGEEVFWATPKGKEHAKRM